MIPKPGWPQLQAATLTAGGLLPLAMLGSPFNFDGPHFLLLYALMFAVAAAMAWGLRFVLRTSAGSSGDQQLDVYEAACLAGGSQQAIRSATAALVQQDVLVVRREDTKVLGFLPSGTRFRFVAAQSLRQDAPEIEQAIYRARKGQARPRRNCAGPQRTRLPG